MDKTQILEKLRSIGQQHLFSYFDKLNESEQQSLIEQIDSIKIPLFRMQQQMLLHETKNSFSFLEPFKDYSEAGNPKEIEVGNRLIAEGKAGCILVAGGQGTRLQFHGPKGMYPISNIRKKSLFQIFAEKTIAAGKKAGRRLPLAVMTSPQNHLETLRFFEDHSLFGLDPSQLLFFTQGMLPLLDHRGNLFLDQPGRIATGPDGNGSTLKKFCESGIHDIWYRAGVRYVSYVLVDNPLADPFDPQLIGHHHSQGGDIIIKCTERQDPKEKVGLLVRHEDHVKVIEYSEFPPEEQTAMEGDKLKHRCANLSLFSFSMDFIKKTEHLTLPFHLAHKAVPFLNEAGITTAAQEPNAWKYEEFIFDLLPHALTVRALLYPRDQCFAPLKSLYGQGGVPEVQQALQQRDKQIFSEISGLTSPNRPFELSQEFYYPTENLLGKWKGRPLPENGDYIEA